MIEVECESINPWPVLGVPARAHPPLGLAYAPDVLVRAEVLGQRKLFQRALPGFMHALIFWGFLVLLTTIVEVIGQLIDPAWEIPLVGGSAWLGLVQDVFAFGVLVGLSIAVWIRVLKRPERFVGSPPLPAPPIP